MIGLRSEIRKSVANRKREEAGVTAPLRPKLPRSSAANARSADGYTCGCELSLPLSMPTHARAEPGARMIPGRVKAVLIWPAIEQCGNRGDLRSRAVNRPRGGICLPSARMNPESLLMNQFDALKTT